MTDDINTLYYNDFGIAFQWKRCAAKDFKKVQLVFKDSGLFLSRDELKAFSHKIEKARHFNTKCKNCNNQNACRLLLLETPAPQISFAVNQNELKAIEDLVEGTLFQLGLDHIINRLNGDN